MIIHCSNFGLIGPIWAFLSRKQKLSKELNNFFNEFSDAVNKGPVLSTIWKFYSNHLEIKKEGKRSLIAHLKSVFFR